MSTPDIIQTYLWLLGGPVAFVALAWLMRRAGAPRRQNATIAAPARRHRRR